MHFYQISFLCFYSSYLFSASAASAFLPVCSFAFSSRQDLIRIQSVLFDYFFCNALISHLFETVSYTHLDVYKRQGTACICLTVKCRHDLSFFYYVHLTKFHRIHMEFFCQFINCCLNGKKSLCLSLIHILFLPCGLLL